MSERPAVRRSVYFDRFPQLPHWFLTPGHFAARERFRKKLAHQYRYETVRICPLCGSTETRLVANQERHGFPTSVVLCMGCALLRTSPRLDRASLEDHYRTDAQALKRGETDDVNEFLFDLQRNKGVKIVEFLSSEAVRSQLGGKVIRTVAEVGCGEGGAVEVFAREFGSARGFELNPQAVEFGRRRGLDLVAEAITASKDRFDLLVYEQVFEHILDPHDELTTLSSVQAPGDLLYIGVPGLLDFPRHYEGNFLSYLEFQHMHHFTLATLERFLAAHQYRLVEGNEEIQALFVKESQPVTPRIPAQSPEEILAFLARSESAYRSNVALGLHAQFVAREVLHRAGLGFVERSLRTLRSMVKRVM